MNCIDHTIISFLLLLHIHYLTSVFSPDPTDYDAYGVKVAINDILLVQAHNARDPPSFFIQFAPYNNTQNSPQCFTTYSDLLENYVYCVAVGKKPNQNQTQFFFAGESVNGSNRTFMGVAKYNLTNTLSNLSNSCATSFTYSMQYLNNYEHQEYFVIGVEPKGLLAYGFSNAFVCIFDSQNASTLESWNSSLTWSNTSFTPHAVEISDNFGIIAGFIKNNQNDTVKYSPIIYLLNFNSSNRHPIVVDQHIPLATANTWQDLLTNADADIYSAKYSMSISINSRGDVLVGMQFLNRVFLLSVNISNPIQLINVSRHTNGRSLGNGRSVAWLDGGNVAAILVNTYSLTYQWSSSQIHFYDMISSTYNSNSTPLSVFPNYHQLLPKSFSSVFLNVISSPKSITLMDDIGSLLIFNPTSAGFYPSIPETGIIPFITSEKPCLPGMYKDQYGINDCILCPIGMKNPGNATIKCILCASESFCSVGSVDEISHSALETVVQVIAYPESPESTIFEEILIHNMFQIGKGHCLVVSPLFWTLIVAGVGIFILIVVGILHCFNTHRISTRLRRGIKSVFKKTDLIREGELWVGGLASFSLVVMVSFAYVFSNGYFKQYPIETTSDSYFACDPAIRNAKFQTNLESLAIPPSETEKNMFELLNDQNLTLNVDFINTLINCDVISLRALFGTTWSTIRWSTCENVHSILSLSIPLPFQLTSVEITLDSIQIIGALRIGLSGHSHEEELYNLKELHAFQSFSKNGSVLARTLPVALSLTKVINETLPMEGEEGNFTGIYILTYGTNTDSLFLSQDQYGRSTSQETIMTIVISETPFYVKNVQEPIAKQAEIIFRTILFTIVCLEIFGLVFILYKLILEPIYRLLRRACFGPREKYKANDQETNDDLKYTNENPNDANIVNEPMTFKF
ncbi:unnamed protein product [Rotaria sp. Silwood2]|nr:unnamed protein product [Rotaria sp. Silwood2]